MKPMDPGSLGGHAGVVGAASPAKKGSRAKPSDGWAGVCTARRSNGEPCRAPAIRGGTVCRVHGGACPQVREKAKLRLMMASDMVAQRLLGIALTQKSKRKDSDVIAACREVLDRAGVRHEPERERTAEDGTVLWEEFIQIHRRRVPVEAHG